MRRIPPTLRRLLAICLFAALPLFAQDEENEQAEEAAPAAEQQNTATAPAPAVPAPEHEDAFVPSEEISLDKSVAFPADI